MGKCRILDVKSVGSKGLRVIGGGGGVAMQFTSILILNLNLYIRKELIICKDVRSI